MWVLDGFSQCQSIIKTLKCKKASSAVLLNDLSKLFSLSYEFLIAKIETWYYMPTEELMSSFLTGIIQKTTVRL